MIYMLIVLIFFSFVSVILANYKKMVVLVKRLK